MIYLVSNRGSMFESTLWKDITLEESLELLLNHKELALDTETEGLNPHTKKLLLLQLGNEEIQIVYDIESFSGIIPEKLKKLIQEPDRSYIIQNAKFDLKFLFKQGIVLTNIYDTMLAETIITHGLQYDGRDLKTIVEKYCGATLDKSIRDSIGKINLNSSIIYYAANDVKHLHLVKRKQLSAAKSLDLVKAIELDNSFVVVLAYTEYCGIKLDYNKWKLRTNDSVDQLTEFKNDLENKILADGKTKYFSGMYTLFEEKQDCTLNWNSPKQVIDLFNDYGIKTEIKVKGESKVSIEASVLKPQSKDFPIIDLYLKYKEKQKEVSTYGYNWEKYINPVTGRIHTTFQQIMNTGRLSSGNKRDGTPNLQNIPSDEETRSCFISEEGNKIIGADYSSQEQILLANQSKEPNLIEFYHKGFSDMHSYVAFLMYEDIRRVSIEELTPESLTYIKKEYPEKRFLAKTAGFAINYGGDGSTIARNCNIPRSEGDFVYNSYFKAFPQLKTHFDLVFRKASHFGYILFNNVTRRKYFFNTQTNDYFALRDIVEDPVELKNQANPFDLKRKYSAAKSEMSRIAQNYPIQGSSADVTKLAGIYLFSELLKRNLFGVVKIVNFIHDEILLECPESLAEEIKELLVDCMVKAGKPFCPIVPLKADAVIGDYWIH